MNYFIMCSDQEETECIELVMMGDDMQFYKVVLCCENMKGTWGNLRFSNDEVQILVQDQLQNYCLYPIPTSLASSRLFGYSTLWMSVVGLASPPLPVTLPTRCQVVWSAGLKFIRICPGSVPIVLLLLWWTGLVSDLNLVQYVLSSSWQSHAWLCQTY